MSKMTLSDITSLANEQTVVATLNSNAATIETISDTFLSRNGTSPNQMVANLDMNSNRVLNLPVPSTGVEPLRLQDYNTLLSGGSITAGAPTNSSYVTLGTDVTLSAERVLTAGTGITLTDTGAGGTITIARTTPWVFATDFGVVADGATDNTTALQNLLNAGGTVVLPKGTVKITGSLTVVTTGTSLIGLGISETTLTSSSTSDPIISVNNNVNGFNLVDLTLTRSVTAIPGGNGVVFAGLTELSFLKNVWIEKQYVGIFLQTTDQSWVQDVTVTDCLNDGIVINNTAGSGTCQWFMHNILSQKNAGRGFLIASIAGPSQITLGEMTNLYTFANSSFGFYVAGTPGVPIHGIRLSNCFFGEDGNNEIVFDTYGGLHTLTKVFVELAGTRTTGPGVATPASHVGSGFLFTANNTNIELIGSRSDSNSDKGLDSAATILGITGGSFTNNGANAAAPGISISGASTIRVIGTRSGGSPQNFGFATTAAAINGVVQSNDFSGTGGGVSDSSTGTSLRIINNAGYNPIGTSAAATMGASPTTVTAGHSPETHYVKQAATNTATITKGGQQIHALIGATTYYTVELGPNESYVTTWTTTAPTYTKDVH